MDRLQTLFQGYLDNRLTADEFTELFQLLEKQASLGILSPQLQALWEQHPLYSLTDSHWDEQMQALKAEASAPANVKKSFPFRRWAAAAAAVVLLAGGAAYWIGHRNPEQPTIAATQFKGDVQPGHNGAVLHLSNGASIVLDSAQNGTVATQGTIQAVKSGGELKYIGKATEPLYNTITTDRGRQWQLILPDGTKVWLNAASSIHYPLTFSGPTREVEISGEAYLEVAHNPRQPFRVKVGRESIEDIGTSFDVNAYTDEPAMRTTLVEGSVKIGGVTLKPGQQAIANGNIQVKSDVDVEEVMAWKNGQFDFSGNTIEPIMRQIARWYDVEIEYRGALPTDNFMGSTPRQENLSELLKILEQTGTVRFQIEGKKLIVMKQ